MSEHESESESSDEDSEPQLRDTLVDCFQKSAFEKTLQDFVPEGVIERIIALDDIERELNIQEKSSQDKDLVQFVETSAKRGFAVAVYAKIDVKQAMKWLKTENLNDEKLPLIKVRKSTWLKGWRKDFCEAQWKFFAPVFDTTRHSHTFEESRILPFISMSTVSGEGAFGQVSHTVVHADHMKPTLLNNGELAVKEIKAHGSTQEVAEHWEREVKALRMMNDLQQEHIVRFITAFRRLKRTGEEHYVMFEWADGGNLRNLWERVPSPILTGELIKHVVDQIYGLAAALSAAHNLEGTNTHGASYRHGDLKPENILVFQDNGPSGILKIGDWGEAKFHGQITAIRGSRTTTKFGTRRYEAPEVDTGVKAASLGQSTKRRSRLCDVWAMGCITLEYIVWLLYGKRGLDQFHRDVDGKTFYTTSWVNGEKVAQVHPNALAWMDRMAELPVCKKYDTALGDLLDIVRNNLLVVKLPLQLGSELAYMDPDQNRADSVHDPDRADMNDWLDTSPDGMEALSIFEEAVETDNPAIVITPADPQVATEPIPIPFQPRIEPEESTRWHARIFRDRMDSLATEDQDGYWEVCQQKFEAPTDLSSTDPSQASDQTIRPSDAHKKDDYASPELDENYWKLLLDNEAAVVMFDALRQANALSVPSAKKPSELCNSCNAIQAELRVPGFWKRYDMKDLRVRASLGKCDLCVLLWHTCKRNGCHNKQTVQFDREGAFLKMENIRNPVLSLVSTPESGAPMTSDCQHGFVELPEVGGTTHLEIIRYWLRDCDQNHHCKPSAFTNGTTETHMPLMKPRVTPLPTRLLDVGVEGDSKVFLWATQPHHVGEWVALSHRWGVRNFKTTNKNLEDHIAGIITSNLPATFKDAVTVTRALGKRFLWIDSLCIVQGPGGDFQSEAKRMADVYSGAYCIIAASCADNHYDGFLKRRTARKHVTMPPEKEGQSAYQVCETIDSFKQHVLDGALCLRGWVLQEHALARRTLFFTEHQTYFECKAGVRCETSTKLKNVYAEFLGDPDFPSHLYQTERGEKILRIQKLYKDYSRLGFTQPYDRPVAIDGLQQKLFQTILVEGGFGVIDDKDHPGWLCRSLLWVRDPLVPTLTRIAFPHDCATSRVPSWSWMAFDGGIDYLHPDFGGFDWEPLQPPCWPIENNDPSNIAMIATAWEYDLEAAGPGEGEVVFDIPGAPKPAKRICVVLGKAKGSLLPDSRKHWVLVIAPTARRRKGSLVYERIGAGYMPGRCLSRFSHKDNVHIH